MSASLAAGQSTTGDKSLISKKGLGEIIKLRLTFMPPKKEEKENQIKERQKEGGREEGKG